MRTKPPGSPAEPLDESATLVKPRLRGLSHELAFGAALALGPLLIVVVEGVAARLVAAGYATAIAALFGVSALYHRPTWSPRARAVMRRLDHSTIYVAIAATYTPIGAFVLPTASARLILGVVWGGAMAGIALRFAWSSAPAPVVALPYVALGWAAVLVMGDVWASMPRPGAVLLMVGGGLYTLGALIYALRRPDPWPRWFGYHEIFHVLVIGGAATHYVAVAYFALPR